MEQLEKEDSTIVPLEYYQSGQCDDLSIRLIPISKEYKMYNLDKDSIF